MAAIRYVAREDPVVRELLEFAGLQGCGVTAFLEFFPSALLGVLVNPEAPIGDVVVEYPYPPF